MSTQIKDGAADIEVVGRDAHITESVDDILLYISDTQRDQADHIVLQNSKDLVLIE